MLSSKGFAATHDDSSEAALPSCHEDASLSQVSWRDL